ncbi:MAG: diacylglycerol kinase family lipid kinase [Ruminococcaceae bacterium]|nr:diacylglycerol kinase family lipid kinase [Oscillospiraceae bacterium]
MKKMLFILNPNAGQRRANRYLADILAIFNRADYDVSVFVTSGQGQAREIAKTRAGEVDLVVCCGGDGTYNETMTGLLQSGAEIPIGYIPAGSTNDFASSLGLPADPLAAAKMIAGGRVRRYDVGSFGGRHFAYVASFGAFTRTSYATPQSIKNSLGHMAYLLEGIQELSQIKTHHLRIEMGSEVIEDDFLFGAICNSTSLGGILKLDPGVVDMQDGKFELLLVRAPKDIMELTACLQAVQTKKYNCKMMTFLNAGDLCVYAPDDMPWSIDGEKEEGRAVIEVKNLQQAIGILC